MSNVLPRLYLSEPQNGVVAVYTLIGGKNDSVADAEELAGLLLGAFRGTGAPIHVNLIRVNEVEETGFTRGSRDSVEAFAARLNALGVTATVRRRLGADVNAACGQLRRQSGKRADGGEGHSDK